MITPRTLHYKVSNGLRAYRKWIVPYLQSRIYASEFRPLLSYLFTDWKCNMACHYCYTYDNKVPGMTLETAFQAIDWLKTTGCRVIAIMGGEVLLRKDFILEVIRYGICRGFFLYLPTNCTLMDEAFIDEVGAAGVAAINPAVDCIDAKPGLPKALSLIERQFRYLIKQKEKYGYVVFLNVNITSKNMKDVRELTKIAGRYKIGVDYHINERPHIEQDHYRHSDNDTYIGPDQLEEADELLDWIIERNRNGQPMINSASHLAAMKEFIRGRTGPWICRAGQNSSAIRIDGTLSPCFGLYSSKEDWGSVFEGHRFDARRLDAVKKECLPRCLSTCQFNMGDYYSGFSIVHWLTRHSAMGGRWE